MIQATIGGDAPHFRVSQLDNRVYRFLVSYYKPIGLFISKLDCLLLSVTCSSSPFTFWGNGGPNWRHEFKLILAEEKHCWSKVPSAKPGKRSFADVVRSTPLSGANRVPLGEKRQSSSVFDRLSFPRRSVFDRLVFGPVPPSDGSWSSVSENAPNSNPC